MRHLLITMLFLVMPYSFAVTTLPSSEHPADKQQRERNRLRLWQQAEHRHSIVATSSSTDSAEDKKRRRQVSLSLLNRGIIPESSGLGWALLTPDELLRETGSPKLLATLEKVVATLQAQIGLPYRWGGQTPNQGFDCSGLVWFAFRHYVNWPLPRTASTLFNDKRMTAVGVGRLRRGDLIFFTIHRQTSPDHVGVYLGNNQFIEAPRTGLAIRISQLDTPFWQQHYAGARRVLTDRTLRDQFFDKGDD
ncbi:C40 family peptidase [Rosenbergiella sp. S61]|uniref:C40 family peptidase n=1 Tax=Rosenbergiella gaditana TaxID=2726987 RepID=A0ABS5T0C7_9GAMM|nr:C40 family peptidase [Rosenbergiella gaditana]MBT0725193.1 C40 family peptidase [Rosenbergiella gaditana]